MATVKINSDNGGTPVTINSGEASTRVTINNTGEKITPPAPVIINENNVTKQILFNAPSGYAANQCAYKVKGGAPVNAISTVIQFDGDADLEPGDVEIYVKASSTLNQSESIFSTGTFTPEIFITGVTTLSDAEANFYTSGNNGMFLNVAEVTRITTSATAIKVIFKLSFVSSTLTLWWFFVYRKDGSTYDRVKVWQLVPLGDLVVGVNEMYLPSQWDVQAGDYVGWAYSPNTGNAAMFPRFNDSEGVDMYRATVISAPATDKDFEAGTPFSDGYWPIILKAV